jgi:hypothetical protein
MVCHKREETLGQFAKPVLSKKDFFSKGAFMTVMRHAFRNFIGNEWAGNLAYPYS